jgi:hypothetical protein
LCHGDPRADNLVFRESGSREKGNRETAGRQATDRPAAGHQPTDQVVLFDWQQMAIQFGEADVAWLAATSLDVEVRRRTERDLVEGYGGSFDRYRLGLALPGLTVLLLAQREATTERTGRFIATSLQRIGAAIADLNIDAIG